MSSECLNVKLEISCLIFFFKIRTQILLRLTKPQATFLNISIVMLKALKITALFPID